MTDRTVKVRVVAELPGLASTMKAGAATVAEFGDSAAAAGRGVRALGTDAAAAQSGIRGLAAEAKGGAAGLLESEAAGVRAGKSVRGAANEAEAAKGAFARIGDAASSGLGKVKQGAENALEGVQHLGLLLAGGAILYGLHDLVEIGNEYSASMYKFSEVTRASGLDMASAGREAQALGADMKLPGASAAEAADAMVELAKAGLSAGDAIKAARGTIQLASAARTDIATAAKIEGDAMDEFGLKASDATHVADVLANTVNSSSGDLVDMAYAMKYVGPVAHGMGISITDLATAVGLLGKSGIIGETAGTAIRSALVNMAKPTKQAAEGLKALGIQAYDSQGNFKGLGYVITQLGDAQKTMSNEQFTAAATMAFGKPALAAMIALAHQGGPAFQQFGLQVGRVGGAAAIAAAESKGLGGAMTGLGKELTSAALQMYLGVSPVLESVARAMASSVADAIPYIQRGIKTAADLWDVYGPAVEKKLAGTGAQIGKDAQSWMVPLESGLFDLANTTVPLAVTSFTALDTIFGNIEKALVPIDSGLQDLVTSVTSGAGALGVFEGRLQAGVSLLGNLSGILGPIGATVGELAHAFAGLPGPIQLSVISMLAMRPFKPQIDSMKQSVSDFGRSAVDSFGQIRGAMSMQAMLAQQAGESVGRLGLAYSALEARSPMLQQMGTAFRGVTSQIGPAATGMERFGGTLKGLSAAAGVGALQGLKSAASGVLGVFGGPWGLAIGGAMMLLDYFSQKQQAAQQRVDGFTQAIQQDSGALGTNTRALAAQTLQQQGLFDIGVKYGIQQSTLTDAALGNAAAIKQVNEQLQLNGSHLAVLSQGGTSVTMYETLNTDAQKLKNTLGDQNDALNKSIQAYKNEQAAINGSSAATVSATSPTGRLQAAISTLGNSESDAATKASALHTALQLLSGGELDVEAATAQMNQNILDLNSAWKNGVTKADGYGKALLQTDGSLNTLTQNGQDLFNKLQQLGTGTANAAQATLDYAKASGSSLPQALTAAEVPMQQAWAAAVKAGEAYGLTSTQAQQLAAQMGLIPSSLALTITDPGMSQTQKDLLYVEGLQGHLDAGSTVKVSALTDEATKQLEAVGFKITTLPGGRQVEITVPTAGAFASLNSILAKENAIPDRTVNIHYLFTTSGAPPSVPSVPGYLTGHANGDVIHYANGGTREDHSPQIAPAGAWRVWAEPETGGEAYIPLGQSKRPRSKALLEQVARMMGGRVAWFAGGGMSAFAGGGFTYTPNLPVLGGATDPMTRYTAAVKALEAAWKTLTSALAAQTKAIAALSATRKRESQYVKTAEDEVARVRSRRHTRAELVAAEDRLTAARKNAAAADDAAAKKAAAATKAVSAARSGVYGADANLGVARGAKAPAGFDLDAYKKQLADSLAATEAWRKNLAAVGARGGSAVEQILQNMGADGTALTAALAKASKKDFDTIVANLQRVSDQAKATLADFDTQVSNSAKTNAQFAGDLSSLAARGYGSLAQQLASQGDQSAMDLAREAAGASDAQLAKINGDVQKQGATLSGQDLQNALLVITSLRSRPGEGISDVINSGIAAQDLLTLVPKIMSQIQTLPDAYKRTFLQQWATQTGATAMATGGILPDGSYTVLAGERGTGGEAYIPLGGAHRQRSTGLLGEVAGRFGYQLIPARAFAASATPASGGPSHVTHHREVHLHGAKQDTATQAADILRHMVALG